MLAVVLVTTGLAGCIGSDDARVEAPNTTSTATDAATNASLPTFPNGTPAPERLQFRDCYQHLAVVPVLADAYRSRVPDGFSLTTFQDEPTGASARLAALGFECTVPGGDTVSRAWTVLQVDPPAAWEDANATAGYYLILAFVTDSERVADVEEAWGLGPVSAAGEVRLEESETPTARTGTLEASAGSASFTVQSTGGEQPQGGDDVSFTARQFAAGEDGNVAGAKDITWTGSFQAIRGGASVSGSAQAGMPAAAPLSAGVGTHIWGFDHTETYVDLPPREGS